MKQTMNINTDFALKRLLEKGVVDENAKGIFIDRDLVLTEKDISILDSRANLTYKEEVLNALPESKVTYSIEDIREFVKSKKTTEYFMVNHKGGEVYDH